MALSAGTHLGAYEVLSPLGAGGMGEVYRARDTRLKRDVALKVLPALFADDPDRMTRFQREAELLATLNHPNVAAVYGLEKANGITAIVLELVEGETLADAIARGLMPFSEAAPIVRQIADALEAAHEKGVIHRDLKPSNIKFTREGKVKVLDFGLAKLVETEAGGAGGDLTHSPTLSVRATYAGMILGTAAYMSPEQARGKPVDKRTDIWAFGCVLYEMLTGKAAFDGDSTLDVLSSVLNVTPDLAKLPAGTPPPVRVLIGRCLQKDRNDRLRDIVDARFQLEDARLQAADAPIVQPGATRSAARERRLWMAATVLVALAGLAAVWFFRRPPVEADEVRLDISTPWARYPGIVVISPDGRKLVFEATTAEGSRLWIRSLNSGSTRPLVSPYYGPDYVPPMWSPDSRSVAFISDDYLKEIDVESGLVQTLAAKVGAVAAGGTRNRDGIILVGNSTGDPISRVSPSGDLVPVTPPAQAGAKYDPRFFPDGVHFLYQVAAGGAAEVFVGDTKTRESRRLLVADAAAYWSGQLLFVRDGTLFSQRFDPVRLELSGSISRVADNVNGVPSVSLTGRIAYRAKPPGDINSQLIWFDRDGKEIGKISEPGHRDPWSALSPDGRRLAVTRETDGNRDIWLLDVERGVVTRFTSDAAGELNPVWSPDGSRIVFSSLTNAEFSLYEKSVATGQVRKVSLGSSLPQAASDWSRDGRFLLAGVLDAKTGTHIWAVPMQGEAKPFPVAQTRFDENHGQFSPDGKWMAYQANDSGRFEVYVQPFPGPGTRSQVSTGGGVQVRWRHDGKELFYLTLDGRLMAVPIKASANGASIAAGKPVPLFLTRIVGIQGTNVTPNYFVSPDSQRFLVDTLPAETPPIRVILNLKPGERP